MEYRCSITTPIGILELRATDRALEEIHFNGKEIGARSCRPEASAILAKAAKQLQEYFDGRRRHFDLPLEPRGTPFQRSVWRELQKIPYGETITYGEIAARLGKPAAVRAVGASNGCNPIPIVIPCHRVIGANGSLVGFGGGLDKKRYLLRLEAGEHALAF